MYLNSWAPVVYQTEPRVASTRLPATSSFNYTISETSSDFVVKINFYKILKHLYK